MSSRAPNRQGLAVAGRAMIATSQPVATEAGRRVFRQGGNAVDAALAAAGMLCLSEHFSTGVGGDVFAVVWKEGILEGLDAAGPAPRCADPLFPVMMTGPRSVTVPGAVAGWDALAKRYGRLGLEACLAPAIDAAEDGFTVAAGIADRWSDLTSYAPRRPLSKPRRKRIRLPELAATLREIARGGAPAFYQGRVAEAICSASWLEEDDLAEYTPLWVEPLRASYRSFEVVELPPPTQGVAALEALLLLEGMEPDLVSQIRCVMLALEDTYERVRDGADVADLLSPDHLERRRRQHGHPVAMPPGGTVCICAIDEERTAVSFIQSLAGRAGSGVVAPGTGVLLHNRAYAFGLQGQVVPGRRPFHTLIPGLLLRDGELVGPFGVMGGSIQAQAHVQIVSAVVDRGLDPQSALDQPRFRIEGEVVRLEQGLWEQAEALERKGLKVFCDSDMIFGGGQAVMVDGDALLGGSDRRQGGYAAGL